MSKPIYIYGAGGLGREVLSLLWAIKEWEVKGFFDDTLPVGELVNGIPVIGDFNHLSTKTDRTSIVVALGDPSNKWALVNRLSTLQLDFPTIVHPSALIQDQNHITIGAGSIVCAGSVLTTNISVGRHVLINLNATIGHDCSVGDFTSIMPGCNLAGGVKIAARVLIGSGANIRNNVRVGDQSTVGMGSVVLNDVADRQVVVGVPAKPLAR